MAKHASKALLLLSALALLGGCHQEINCIRAIQCVERCGGPVVSMACECPGGTFDQDTCLADGGADGGTDGGP